MVMALFGSFFGILEAFGTILGFSKTVARKVKSSVEKEKRFERVEGERKNILMGFEFEEIRIKPRHSRSKTIDKIHPDQTKTFELVSSI